MNCSEMPDTLGFMIIYTGKMLLKSVNTDFVTLNSEITFEQMGLLYYISKNGDKDMIQQDIANLLNKTKSAVLRTLDILEEKKFLKRVAMPDDRRKNVIHLTSKGCEVISKMHEKFLEMETELIKEFTKDEQKTCMSVLLKIQNKCT
ncbi:MAG: MarR family transcriptional regulator [Ginsengibacter sp.]